MPAFTRFARSLTRNWQLYILILPSLFFSAIFFYYPITSGFYHSFTYWDIKQTVWVGLENYIRLFDDSSTPAAWRNMAIILISNMLIVCIFPLFGAVLVVRLRNAVL
ncbi:MAG: sugar ABC transporter permease, partial [Chloroflexi bacterium]|nr:sugar ABC transporter permease [Chloroflexota bacterium]